MKKSIGILLSLLLLLSSLPLTVFAAETYVVSFAPGTGTGEMEPEEVQAGAVFPLPDCGFTHTNTERSFYKWSVNGELYDPGVNIEVVGDTVVTATWKYKRSAAVTVDNAVDKSTTEVLGVLTLTNTTTGETAETVEYDEVAASVFVNPSNPTVNAMLEEASAALAQKAAEKAGGSPFTTLKDGIQNLKVTDFSDERFFTYAYITDEAGDYYQALTIEGVCYKKWQYTVVLEAEYAGPANCIVSFAPGTGAGEMAPVPAAPGESVKLPECGFIHPNPDRVFYKWSVNGELKEPGETITVNGDVTVTAMWKYASGDLVNVTQDTSTANYVGVLVLTETGSGVTTTQTLYDETVASSYEMPQNGEVSKLSGACISALMTAANSYPDARVISDDKPPLNAEGAEILDEWSRITFRFEESVDEAGDYILQMYMEGDFGRAWRFTETLTAEYTLPADVLLGDVDGDGCITAGDARLALRRAVDLEDFEPGSREYLAADADRDGAITAGDARMILRAAVELEVLR